MNWYQKAIVAAGGSAAITAAAYLFGVGAPTPAVAQYSACPPGQTQIGETPGGNGIGPTPICGPDGSSGQAQNPAPQSPPPFVPPNYYGAVASTPDGKLFFSFMNRKKSAAAKLALADCKSSSGQTCKIIRTQKNNCVSVAKSASGQNYFGEHGYEFQSAVDALASCQQQTPGKACTIDVPPVCSSYPFRKDNNQYLQTFTDEDKRLMTRHVNEMIRTNEYSDRMGQLIVGFKNFRESHQVQ